jgi:hypothetical protein
MNETIPWEMKEGQLISVKIGDTVFKKVIEEKKVEPQLTKMEKKVCSTCGIEKPSTEYTHNRGQCKECISNRMKEYNKKRAYHNSITSKMCVHCKVVKPASEFDACKKNKDGYQPWCKQCKSTYGKNRLKWEKEAEKQRDIPIVDMSRDENQPILVPIPVEKESNNSSMTTVNWNRFKIFRKEQ